MTAVNLVFQYGINRFFGECLAYGIDAVVIPDLLVDDAEMYQNAAEKHQIELAFFVSPVTPKSRIEYIVKQSTGFIYLISSTGVTGTRDEFSQNLEQITQTIKIIKDIPVLVGFGISSNEQVQKMNSFADGVIVGSYLTGAIQTALEKKQNVETYIQDQFKKLIT